MILAMEIIVLCVFFSVIIIISIKNNSLRVLHNLPKAIQERVSELPEYSLSSIPRSIAVGAVISL